MLSRTEVHRLAIQGNNLLLGYSIAQLGALTVDRKPTLLDPAFHFTSGANTNSGENLMKLLSFGVVLSLDRSLYLRFARLGVRVTLRPVFVLCFRHRPLLPQ